MDCLIYVTVHDGARKVFKGLDAANQFNLNIIGAHNEAVRSRHFFIDFKGVIVHVLNRQQQLLRIGLRIHPSRQLVVSFHVNELSRVIHNNILVNILLGSLISKLEIISVIVLGRLRNVLMYWSLLASRRGFRVKVLGTASCHDRWSVILLISFENHLLIVLLNCIVGFAAAIKLL